MYSKEVKKAVKKNNVIIGYNIVRQHYDNNDKKVREEVITFVKKNIK